MTHKAAIIYVATHKIFDYPLPPLDIVISAGFDRLLDVPDPRQEEKVLITLSKSFLLGSRGQIITTRPDHRVYRSLANQSSEELLSKLSIERTSVFPQTARQVRVKVDSDSPEQKIELEALSIQKPIVYIKKNEPITEITLLRSRWLEFIALVDKYNLSVDPDPLS
jgi:hypothetical protein